MLALLSPAEFGRLAPQLELVDMAQGDVLYQSGGQLTFIYFPVTAVISVQYELEDGGASEIASVGHEGLLGVTLFMGGAAAPNRAVVQSAGHGYRLRAGVLLAEFHRKGPLFDLLMRYTRVLMVQLAQSAVCNGHHSTVQRLCRWLLQALDHSPSSELAVTQEALAGILGVRREGITEAAGRLQTLGLISCRRGHIRVLTRAGLDRHVYECYGVMRQETTRLLATSQPSGPAPEHRAARGGQPNRRTGRADRRASSPLGDDAVAGEAQLDLLFP